MLGNLSPWATREGEPLPAETILATQYKTRLFHSSFIHEALTAIQAFECISSLTQQSVIKVRYALLIAVERMGTSVLHDVDCESDRQL